MPKKPDLLKSIDAAIMKHHEKQLPKEPKQPRGTRKKRGAPEKEVEKAVLKWCKDYKFSVDVVENEVSQAASRGFSGRSATTPGFSDIVGCDKFGRAVFIELKAKGRLKNLSYNQARFLEEKIKSQAFAVVVDSPERLQELYANWHSILQDKGTLDSVKYLLSSLPKTSEQVMHAKLKGNHQTDPDIPF